MLLSVFRLLGTSSTLESVIRRCVREQNTNLLASALTRSVESTTKAMVYSTVDPTGSPTLAEVKRVRLLSVLLSKLMDIPAVTLHWASSLCSAWKRSCSSGLQCSGAFASVVVLRSGVICRACCDRIVWIVWYARRRGERCGEARGWARVWARRWTNGVSGETGVLWFENVRCSPFWSGFHSLQRVRFGPPRLYPCSSADWWLFTKLCKDRFKI